MTIPHTPGPWKNKTFGEVKAKDDAFTVAQCMMGNLGEREANANLIAAAPELLEALKYAREEIALRVVEDGGTKYSIQKACAKLDAAIAKAEGRA